MTQSMPPRTTNPLPMLPCVQTPRKAWLLLTVLLCSCRSLPKGEIPMPPDEARLQARTAQALAAPPATEVAQAIDKTAHVPIECVANEGLPIPADCITPWAPPGIAGPWPRDEYLEDGGDQFIQANIGPRGDLQGLELEDTVAVYDTFDGRTCIEPSNKVCLYAPRFAAVRKTESVLQNLQADQTNAVALPVKPVLEREELLASTAIQPVRPIGKIATRQPSIERVREQAAPTISLQPIAGVEAEQALTEQFRILRQGIFEESEQARLLEYIDAAIVWTHDKAVQVLLDGREAVSVTGDQTAQMTFRVDVPNHPCLRVIKVASTKVAKPGDIVDFTIRFDNTGDQAIARVVLVDNLTTRLEYVADTAQSSRPADFFTERNEGDSLVLRWEFRDPLPAGAGGLVRFHCRVR